MQDLRIESWVSVQRLTPARRLTGLERMALGASELPVAELLQGLIEEAIEAQHQALAMAEAWRLCKDDEAMHAPGAKQLDARLDRSVSALYRTLLDLSQLFETEALLAGQLLEAVFPHGVAELVCLPYVEQHAAVQQLTLRLRGSHAQAIEALQLERWVARIEALNAQYGELLTQPRKLTGQDVRDADTRGYIRLLGVVAAVLGLFPSNSEHDLEGRRVLLQPLLDQQQEASQLYARRRARPEPAKVPPAQPSSEEGERAEAPYLVAPPAPDDGEPQAQSDPRPLQGLGRSQTLLGGLGQQHARDRHRVLEPHPDGLGGVHDARLVQIDPRPGGGVELDVGEPAALRDGEPGRHPRSARRLAELRGVALNHHGTYPGLHRLANLLMRDLPDRVDPTDADDVALTVKALQTTGTRDRNA